MEKKGFTLIELICAISILGVGIPALSYLYNVTFITSASNAITVQEYYLASGLLNEISQRRFQESTDFPGNSPENGEVIQYDRRSFNDIDDYNQFNLSWGELSPPRDESGNPMNSFPTFSQYVEVVNVSPPTINFDSRNFNPQADGSTSFKLVTVTVKNTRTNQEISLYKLFAAP